MSAYKIAGVEHGLIASLADVSASAAWTNVGHMVPYNTMPNNSGTGEFWQSFLIGAKAQNEYNGQPNTVAIIAQSGHTASAAKLCDDYTSGGFGDWYLPAISELNLLYSQDYLVEMILEGDANSATSGFYHQDAYWSSTEVSSGVDDHYTFGSLAKITSFYNYSSLVGNVSGGIKNSMHRVRCVRVY